MLRLNGRIDLRVFQFEHDLLLAFFVHLLLESVNGFADLDGPEFRSSCFDDWLDGGISSLSCSSSGQVRLMLFALRMREVAALIGVQSEAKSALVRSDMIPHEVRILRDVDSLKGQFPQPLLPLYIRVLITRDTHTAYPCAWSVLPINHLIRESKYNTEMDIILLMQPREQFQTLTFNSSFGIREYTAPHCQVDPKRQILERTWMDYKNQPRQKKFQITTRPKVCTFDQIARLTSANPEPSRYKVEGNLLKRYRSASLKKVNLKTKKETYLENIQLFQAKHKPPGVGKFDLTKYTDLGTKRFSKIKPSKEVVKRNNLDDVVRLAAELPGPGQFNPHLEVVKLNTDRTDHKFWRQKHSKQEKRAAKSLSTKLCPNTYSPVKYGTFDSLARDKSKPMSRWSHGSIDIRKGIRSEMKDPSPCQYNTVHQWISTSKKDKPIGNYNLLNRVSSAGNFGVYH